MDLDHWPQYGLRLTTPRLELRLPDLKELDALASVAAAGVHDPARTPFVHPWTDAPPGERARSVLTHFWKTLSEWRPDSWALQLTVFLDGAPIGIQQVSSTDFAVTREVSTGSWLGLSHQGRGLGTEMRSAVLHLAFAELGAESARTSVLDGSTASRRVTERLGYRPDGTARVAVRGEPRTDHRYVLTRADWERNRPVEVRVEGAGRCAAAFGAEKIRGTAS
ncbi:GNAT family protein [Nocardiopsis sp. RSe5-2]|uniref:GNAT family protein n=1 Tax=Nocardiopsis endophytica TaxID=3018445 RepID=A0ABT4U363_9ACTN|nr:GNAT family protein [Nocardiopsis endophytica]MDA2811393.1 GNAT family protein [Nocardiopsis endophytica]